MGKEFGRSQRVASEMQKELAAIMLRDVKDSRLGFVTINDVELSKDLAVAKIFVTVLNADDAGKAANVKVLNEISPFIRHELAKRMRLRHISELHFITTIPSIPVCGSRPYCTIWKAVSPLLLATILRSRTLNGKTQDRARCAWHRAAR